MFIKTLTLSICPKITQNKLNDEITLKHQISSPKLQTPTEEKFWKTLGPDCT